MFQLPKGESFWCLRTWDTLLAIASTDENPLAWILESCLGCEGMNQEQMHTQTLKLGSSWKFFIVLQPGSLVHLLGQVS